MTEDINNNIDLSIQRRRYYSEDCGLSSCPECGLQLIENKSTILIAIKSNQDEAELISNMNGSHFCESCPIVVFDTEMLEELVKLGIRGDENIEYLKYLILGIVNLDVIPEEKRHLKIGINGNPIPLVNFLPDLNKLTIVNKKKIGRNEPCSCGSGKKYKKCCG